MRKAPCAWEPRRASEGSFRQASGVTQAQPGADRGGVRLGRALICMPLAGLLVCGYLSLGETPGGSYPKSVPMFWKIPEPRCGRPPKMSIFADPHLSIRA